MSTVGLRGFWYAVATACLFTAFVLGSRAGLKTSLEPFDIAALRFGVGALVASPVFLRHWFGDLRIWQAAVLALTGGGGFALAAYTGFSLAPASHGSALIHGALPLTTIVVHAALSRRQPTSAQVSASLVTLAGILLMLWDSVGSVSPRQLWGDGSLLLASMLWAAYGICLARWEVPPVPAAAMVVTLSAAYYLPIYAFSSLGSMHTAAWSDICFQAILQGVLIGFLANICYARAVTGLGPARTAAGLAIVPVAVTIGGIFVLGEMPSSIAWCGVCLVVLGVMLHTAIATSPHRPAPSH
jgi:drug/metabolite transporter (DMT)-like permease